MRTLLNVPLLDINRTSQMFAQHSSCVIPFTKITMFPYSEQVQDIELYGTSVGDDIDAKMNYFKHQMVIQCISENHSRHKLL